MATNNSKKNFNRKKSCGAIILLVFGILFFLPGISLDGGFLWCVIGAAMCTDGIYLIAKNSNQ